MFIDAERLTRDAVLLADVCVVGAGPVGIVLSLELARLGLDVLLLESGGRTFEPEQRDLGDATVLDLSRHAPLHLATQRQFGGTSALWGGRCVPLDPIDFERRDFAPNSGWPIESSEVTRHYGRACEYAGCGPADFSSPSALPNRPAGIIPDFHDEVVTSSNLERWASPTNFGRAYWKTIERAPKITCVLHAVCQSVDFGTDPTLVDSLQMASSPGSLPFRARASAYVLACGGLGSTRLLLASDKNHTDGIGNSGGKLGRFYMGHISGKIADIEFETDPRKTVYDFEQDPSAVYCRKRFSIGRSHQMRNRVLNCAFWLDNPRLADAHHRNGVLSLAYLALSTPILKKRLAPEAIVNAAVGPGSRQQLLPHVLNVLRNLPSVAVFAPSFAYRRYVAKRNVPGFFIRSMNNVYALHYHAEHLPNEQSRVWLGKEIDKSGLRKLIVDIRFSDADASSVVENHRILDVQLRLREIGKLAYRSSDLQGAVLSQAGDGFHQIGTTRMSRNERDGVVDTDCKVHGQKNLYVAGSSVFPTSGQANPTLTAMALAVRLAGHLAVTQRA